MKIPQSVRELLAKGPLAHLTTLNKDGSPQVTVVWVGVENDEFVLGHLALHQKVRIFDATRELHCRCLAIRQTQWACANTSWFTGMRA
jgi:hypothetical protein